MIARAHLNAKLASKRAAQETNNKKRKKKLQKQGLAEHKSDKMSNEGEKPLKKGEKGVPKGRNMKITTNKQI